MDIKTIDLTTPVTFADETYAQIKLPPPKGKHLKRLNGSPDLGQLAEIAATISGVPLKVFEEMSASDYIKICTAVGDFLGDGQGIGEK